MYEQCYCHERWRWGVAAADKGKACPHRISKGGSELMRRDAPLLGAYDTAEVARELDGDFSLASYLFTSPRSSGSSDQTFTTTGVFHSGAVPLALTCKMFALAEAKLLSVIALDSDTNKSRDHCFPLAFFNRCHQNRPVSIDLCLHVSAQESLRSGPNAVFPLYSGANHSPSLYHPVRLAQTPQIN